MVHWSFIGGVRIGNEVLIIPSVYRSGEAVVPSAWWTWRRRPQTARCPRKHRGGSRRLPSGRRNKNQLGGHLELFPQDLGLRPVDDGANASSKPYKFNASGAESWFAVLNWKKESRCSRSTRFLKPLLCLLNPFETSVLSSDGGRWPCPSRRALLLFGPSPPCGLLRSQHWRRSPAQFVWSIVGTSGDRRPSDNDRFWMGASTLWELLDLGHWDVLHLPKSNP